MVFMNIKKARSQFGMNVSQFARLMGISRVTVYSWESGKTQPKDRDIDYLRLKLNEIVGGTEDV